MLTKGNPAIVRMRMTIGEICVRSSKLGYQRRQRDVVVTNDAANNPSRRSQSGAKCGGALKARRKLNGDRLSFCHKTWISI